MSESIHILELMVITILTIMPLFFYARAKMVINPDVDFTDWTYYKPFLLYVPTVAVVRVIYDTSVLSGIAKLIAALIILSGVAIIALNRTQNEVDRLEKRAKDSVTREELEKDIYMFPLSKGYVPKIIGLSIILFILAIVSLVVIQNYSPFNTIVTLYALLAIFGIVVLIDKKIKFSR